jgi:hypothetical protein
MSQPQSFPGPIKVSQARRASIESRDLPFFWLGDTAPQDSIYQSH